MALPDNRTPPEPSGEWSAAQQRFIAWLALPRAARKPKTQALLAQELGVTAEQLSRWKRLPGLMDEVQQICRTLIWDDLAEVVAAMVREAKKGSYQDRKMILEMVGMYTHRQEITGANGEPLNIRVVLDGHDEE